MLKSKLIQLPDLLLVLPCTFLLWLAYSALRPCTPIFLNARVLSLVCILTIQARYRFYTNT